MDAERWERTQALFFELAGLPPGARAERLRAVCDDARIAADVEALLEEDERLGAGRQPDVGRLFGQLAAGDAAALARVAFGPYRVRSLLGEGGMGVVYLAERADLGSVAAIKVLRDAWLSPARRERFAAEQRTLAQLGHPSIARLLDAESLPDGTPWLAMEYVEGVPLTDYCRSHGTSLEGRLELLRAVCVAVQYAHGQAVIHRDLKPSNVLVTAAGEVKLLDFGIAKHLEGLDRPVDQTRTGLRLMTPAYAAPEQLRGEPAGIRTDVYSLGVILYELLTLRLPFDLSGSTPSEAAALLAGSEPRRPSAAAGVARPRARTGGGPTWADLDVLCQTAMHPDPARRYATVEALVRDIDHCLADEPLEARPDALGYRLGKFARRHRAAVTAAVAALVVVFGLMVFYTWRLTVARNEAQALAARTARIQRFMLDLFAGGDEAGPSEDLRVVTLVERGIQDAAALASEPLVQAELFRTLGGLARQLGRFGQAEQLLEQALAQQLARLPADDPEVADTRVALGLLRLDQARLDEAEREARAGLEVLQRSRDDADPAVTRATAALGQVLEARGDYDGATEVGERLVEVLDRGGDSADLAAALGQLADSHYYAGNRELSDALNRRVLEVTRQIYGAEHPRVADVLINLGASQYDRGHYAEAETCFRPALDALSTYFGRDHYRSASAMTMLGRSLVSQQRLDEAVPLLSEALAVQERTHGPSHPRVASALNDLGSAALLQDRFDEAEACFERMLGIYRVTYDEGHYLIGTATSNLASVVLARGDLSRAETLFRQAAEIFEQTLSPGDLNTGIARIKLGRTLLRQERFAEAERESLAGYRIVSAQASPSVSWLRSARADLVAEYEALGRPEQAAEFRTPQEP